MTSGGRAGAGGPEPPLGGKILYNITMIVYDLICGRDHEFEGWFKDSASFERQRDKGLIECTVCGSTRISIRPSGLSIKTSKGFRPAMRAVKAYVEYVRDYLEKNFEDVGTRFAEEALKMHYDSGKKRNIRGVTTEREEKMLQTEGVEFHKIALPRFKKIND